MLLCSLRLTTHILATSAFGCSVTRPRASLLAERELEASICVILASVLSLSAKIADDNVACAWASGNCDPYPGSRTGLVEAGWSVRGSGSRCPKTHVKSHNDWSWLGGRADNRARHGEEIVV